MSRGIVILCACLTYSFVSGGGAEADSLYYRAGSADGHDCTVLERAELHEDQRLTFSWRNMCGFPIVVLWRSRADDGGIITGTVTVPPDESASGECRRCGFPDWTESRQDLEPSATRL
jgi:hypothetical protein